MRRQTGEMRSLPEFGWLAGVWEDNIVKDAQRLGRPVGVYVDVRGCSGISQKGVFWLWVALEAKEKWLAVCECVSETGVFWVHSDGL